MTAMHNLGSGIRGEFPILKHRSRGNPLVYLDSASTAQKPFSVIEAEKTVYETMYANVHRGVYELSERATDAYEGARAAIASFIDADADEIIFTRNATEGINIVSQIIKPLLRPGRKVLVTAMEHHSNLVPWQEICRQTGADLVFVEMLPDGRLDMEDFSAKLSEDVVAVAVTAMSNVMGTVNPVADIVKRAHEAGVLVVADAAQAAGRIPISVRKWGVDFVALSGHKMYGPSGIGVLYGKRERLERAHPVMFGGDMVKQVTREGASWNDIPWKFEAGTPNIAGAVALGEAVRFLEGIGLDAIARHEQEIASYALDRMRNISGVTILGPPAEYRGGVISWTMDGIHSHDLASLVDERGIAIRAGHHCAQPLLATLGLTNCARASFSIFTTREDIDTLVDAILRADRQVFVKSNIHEHARS